MNNPELAMSLYESYHLMADQVKKLKSILKTDLSEYPIYIPTFTEDEKMRSGLDAQTRAIQSITQMFMEDVIAMTTGVMCLPEEAIREVEYFNNLKNQFKEAVISIRKHHKDNSLPEPRIQRIIENEVVIRGYRTPDLAIAMKNIGIGSLDLKRCYASIRVMPPGLDSVSWTWASKHSRVLKITVSEAMAMADQLQNEEAKLQAQRLLSTMNAQEFLARRIPLKNQARINFTYYENGEYKRQSSPISGVLIVHGQQLPKRMAWRDEPKPDEERPRLPRTSNIEATPFIQSLKLHRYVQ